MKKKNDYWKWFWIILIGFTIIITFSNILERRSYSHRAITESYYSPVCLCNDNLYNCDDFPTESKAQECYEYCGAGDIHHLDGDDDGKACEWNP